MTNAIEQIKERLRKYPHVPYGADAFSIRVLPTSNDGFTVGLDVNRRPTMPTLGLNVTLRYTLELVQEILMMSNEEIERKMVFIVEQQAQFASDIQRLQESQARTDKVVAQSGEIVARLANVTHVGFNEVNAKINALVDSQIRTEENLRNLVAVVDRYFSDGRNGKSI